MGRFARQGERRGCGSEVFARERSGAGGCASGVASPTLESSILQSTNGFPWQAILLPVGQGYLAMSGDTFACHGLGKEKGGALGSWSVCACVWGVTPPHRMVGPKRRRAGGAASPDHSGRPAARGQAGRAGRRGPTVHGRFSRLRCAFLG